MKTSLVFLFCVQLTFSLLAQDAAFNMEYYLSTAYYDQSLEKYHAQLDFLNNNSYNAPWLSRVELRIGSEDANTSLNDYRLRITPTTPSIIRANKVYHKKQLSSISTTYQIGLNEALNNRYEILIEHYYYSSLLQILQKQEAHYNELLKNIAVNNLQSMDWEDIVDIESDMSEMKIEAEEIKMELAELNFLVSLDLPAESSIYWDSIPIIDIEEVRAYIARENLLQSEQNLYVKEAEDKLMLEEQMLKIKKSESNKNIGYIQGNFDTDKGDDLEDHLGIQVGVRLPIVNPDKPDLNRDKFDLLKEQQDIKETTELVKQRSDVLQIKLQHLFNEQELIRERIERANKIFITSSPNSKLDVWQLAKKQNYQSKLLIKELKVKREIYDLFISYLKINSYLVSKPLKNYLSPNFAPILENN